MGVPLGTAIASTTIAVVRFDPAAKAGVTRIVTNATIAL
jgi:hypothetical protein